MRLQKDGNYFVTDSGNFIFDLEFKKTLKDLNKEEVNLLKIPGVIETGFFLTPPDKLILGYLDGKVNVIRF